MPQVHGAVKDTVAYVASVVEREINSVTDNPTIFMEDDLIISGGNFHGEPLALVLDFLSIAISELGSISERRVYRFQFRLEFRFHDPAIRRCCYRQQEQAVVLSVFRGLHPVIQRAGGSCQHGW